MQRNCCWNSILHWSMMKLVCQTKWLARFGRVFLMMILFIQILFFKLRLHVWFQICLHGAIIMTTKTVAQTGIRINGPELEYLPDQVPYLARIVQLWERNFVRLDLSFHFKTIVKSIHGFWTVLWRSAKACVQNGSSRTWKSKWSRK